MIDNNQLRIIVFSHYDEFAKYAKSVFPYIGRQGLLHNELVNEAIVNIFDVRGGFEGEEQVVGFIMTAIKTVGQHEKESLKDYNFTTQIGSDGEYTKIDKPAFLDVPSDEFIKTYLFLEGLRFGANNEKKICPRCKGVKFYNIAQGLKCGCCGYKMSLTASTYISNMKLKYSVFYKLVVVLCQDPNISTYQLAKKLNITQVTAWKRKRLVTSIMDTTEQTTCSALMERILTSTTLDMVKFKLSDTNKHNKSFTNDEIREIRRLKDVLKAKEIADIYQVDLSNLYKIFKRTVYKNVL